MPGMMKPGNRYKPAEIRAAVQAKGFRSWQVRRFCYRPFDLRWLYWEPEGKLLDEKREDYIQESILGDFAIVSSQHNRHEFDPPSVCTALASLHVIERGCNVFPVRVISPASIYQTQVHLNLSPAIIKLAASRGMEQADFFFHALSQMHTPRYKRENSGALGCDWPRIPIPGSPELLAHSASLGRRLAQLLDGEAPVQFGLHWSFGLAQGARSPSTFGTTLWAVMIERPLSAEEAGYVSSVVRRITSILLLGRVLTKTMTRYSILPLDCRVPPRRVLQEAYRKSCSRWGDYRICPGLASVKGHWSCLSRGNEFCQARPTLDDTF